MAQEKKGLERSDHVSSVFSISHYVVTSWEKDTEWVREWDSVTGRQRKGREGESCCDSLFTPCEWRFFSSPVSILSGLQSVNLSRVIWPRHCVNLEYSSGSFFASRGLRLCWGPDGIPQNVTTICNWWMWMLSDAFCERGCLALDGCGS